MQYFSIDLLRDPDRLQQATIDKDGKRMTTRAAARFTLRVWSLRR